MSTEQRILKTIQILDDLIDDAKRDLAACQGFLADIKPPAEAAPETQQFRLQEFRALTWKVSSNPQNIPQPLQTPRTRQGAYTAGSD